MPKFRVEAYDTEEDRDARKSAVHVERIEADDAFRAFNLVLNRAYKSRMLMAALRGRRPVGQMYWRVLRYVETN